MERLGDTMMVEGKKCVLVSVDDFGRVLVLRGPEGEEVRVETRAPDVVTYKKEKNQ